MKIMVMVMIVVVMLNSESKTIGIKKVLVVLMSSFHGVDY